MGPVKLTNAFIQSRMNDTMVRIVTWRVEGVIIRLSWDERVQVFVDANMGEPSSV